MAWLFAAVVCVWVLELAIGLLLALVFRLPVPDINPRDELAWFHWTGV